MLTDRTQRGRQRATEVRIGASGPRWNVEDRCNEVDRAITPPSDCVVAVVRQLLGCHSLYSHYRLLPDFFFVASIRFISLSLFHEYVYFSVWLPCKQLLQLLSTESVARQLSDSYQTVVVFIMLLEDFVFQVSTIFRYSSYRCCLTLSL